MEQMILLSRFSTGMRPLGRQQLFPEDNESFEPLAVRCHQQVVVQDALTVRRRTTISNRWNGDVASVLDIRATRPEEVSAVGVAAEEGAASEAAALSGDLRQDFGQCRRPQEPEAVSFSIVFLVGE